MAQDKFKNRIMKKKFLPLLNTFSSDTEQLWVWEYETEDGNHDLFMDINEEIRFRIIDEEFVDLTPEGPAPPPVDGEPAPVIENKRSPYTISVCSQFSSTKWSIAWSILQIFSPI